MTMSEGSDSELRLDGNHAAGLIGELLPFEMTTARVTCAGCGAVASLGALPVYERAPGTVVRCAQCDAVQLRIVSDAGRYWIELRGTACLEIRP
jgi:ribosomal protein S27E